MKRMIEKYIDKIKKIDGHEHIPKLSDLAKQQTDLIDLFTPYLCDLVIVCGCTTSDWQKITNKNIEFSERWALMNKFLPHIENATYYKALEFALKECLNCSIKDYKRVNTMLKGADENFYKQLLAKARIEKVYTFTGYENLSYFGDSEIIPVPTVTYSIPYTLEKLRELERNCKIEIESLSDLTRAYEKMFSEYKALKIKNIKIGCAYWTKFDLEGVNYDKAQSNLASVIKEQVTSQTKFGEISENIRYKQLNELEQFCFSEFLRLAEFHGFNIVIHTGFHAWGANDPSACRCDFLYKAIIKFPRVNFILLHCSYPYEDDAITLAKYYPNVFIDLAWVHQLDRLSCKRIICKLIEGVPSNKIIAFGGDYCNPINTVGAYRLSVKNFSEAFSYLIKLKMLNLRESKKILNLWYFENPKKIYGRNNYEN